MNVYWFVGLTAYMLVMPVVFPPILTGLDAAADAFEQKNPGKKVTEGELRTVAFFMVLLWLPLMIWGAFQRDEP